MPLPPGLRTASTQGLIGSGTDCRKNLVPTDVVPHQSKIKWSTHSFCTTSSDSLSRRCLQACACASVLDDDNIVKPIEVRVAY